jgi:ribosome production factor 1
MPPPALNPSDIKNAQKRATVFNKLRLAKAAAKTERRKKRAREEKETGVKAPRQVRDWGAGRARASQGDERPNDTARQRNAERPEDRVSPHAGGGRAAPRSAVAPLPLTSVPRHPTWVFPHTPCDQVQEPNTLENTREFDDTVVAPDDAEVAGDEADDEFAGVWAGGEVPKVMVTTQQGPSGKIFPVIAELLNVVPNSFYYRRGRFELSRICEWAADRSFTHVAVLTERRKVPNGLLLVKLPAGPTAAFKLRSTVLPGDIAGHGRATTHVPEVLLNRFGTRLGRRVGRLLGSLFPPRPDFGGRQVVTFHNQRDFIFFRRHRYVFEDGGTRARMQELGPRFTLKLRYLLAGPFDPRFGEYEWLYHRGTMEDSRRRFQL